MKIGILTQPLHNNYGGLLQNYALQSVLVELGHEVFTINIQKKDISLFRKIASITKRSLLRILRHDIVIRIWPTRKESRIISQNTGEFVLRYILTTNKISKKVDEKLLENYKFEAYVVGSDQVWRPKYSPQLPTFFLDFLETNLNVIKIAYAASFGVDEWEFTKTQTTEFKSLTKLFNAISVREDSAVNLCNQYLNVKATHLLDPTMLLNKETYMNFANDLNIKESSGKLFNYILDKSDNKNKIIDSIISKYDLIPFSVMALGKFSELGKRNLSQCVYPPVEEWIRGFMEAEFVVTDSFHGTVFSIIFNKPFISIANKDRGLTRFTSLLKLFQLEDRLVYSCNDLELDEIKPIDWKNVNTILKREKISSIQFLKEHLSSISQIN